MNKFPCNSCGLCCRHIKRTIQHIGITDFPYRWDEQGACEMLTKDNKCAVYDTRPFICNVDAWIDKYSINRAWFYKVNEQACEVLKKEELINEIDKDIFQPLKQKP